MTRQLHFFGALPHLLPAGQPQLHDNQPVGCWGGSGASAVLVVAASAKMVWRYDNRQNSDLKEEEETPGKDKGRGQDGAADSMAMEVDEIDFRPK